MKRMLLLCIFVLFFFSGCTKSVLKDGTYEKSAEGYGGKMNVVVVIEGGKLSDIRLGEHRETSPVIKRAMPVIRRRIIEAQTPLVDSVSGATFSSFAVKSAVAAAMKDAGTDVGSITMATKGQEKPAKTLDTVSTDLLIIGGGPAGLSAAVSARENGVEHIILVEKLDILSGNGKFDMLFFNYAGTLAQKKAGIEDSADQLYADLMKRNLWDSPARLRAQADGCARLDAWLRGMGIELNYVYDKRSHLAEEEAYAGEEVQDGLERKVEILGIDVRTGTKAVDLIMDANKVSGAHVVHGNESYDIRAKAVLIATGGFSCNKELLAKYAPGSEVLNTSNQMGATGDFIPLFEKYGLKTDQMDVLKIFKFMIPVRRDLTGARVNGAVLVNKEGLRFVSESSADMPFAEEIHRQTGHQAYYIYDQYLYDSTYRLRKHYKLGYHKKADTLEALSKELGIDGNNLVFSVEQFNKAARGDAPDPFTDKPFNRPLMSTGPYYGVPVQSCVHMTKGGVVADEYTRVLDNNGQVVDGLYAAGEVTCTSGIYLEAVIFGRLAGEQIALYLK